MTCLVCERIQMIKDGTNPFSVSELETGYVVLGDSQFFRGYTLFLCKMHVPELHMLPKPFRMKFLEEMSIVAEAVWNWVQPEVMNYEALGNAEPHLHWHLFPRHKNDPLPTKPVWQIPKETRMNKESYLNAEDLQIHRHQLKIEIEKLME